MAIIKDRVVWVTGASSGIGEALVYELASKGARLVISARRAQELERVKAYAEARYQAEVLILPLDLTDPDSFPAKANQVMDHYRAIDILINNGGISQRGTAADTQMAVDRRIMEVDYFGTVALTKAVIPYMQAAKRGHLAVVSSLVGKFGTPRRSAYAAAKHALHGFFDSLRAELWKQNINVTIICPGYVRTSITKHALKADGETYEHVDNFIEKGMPPIECAKAIVKAIRWNREEVYIGGWEKAAVYAKRFFPGLFSEVIKRRSDF